MPVAVIGLGNFPKRYENTRHNIGYKVVEEYVTACGVKWTRPFLRPFKQAKIGGARFFLPLTYMNNSGKIVPFVRKSVSSKQVLVVLDDMDLPFGSLRIRLSGGSGGHNGLESIISAFGTRDVPRLRIGIDRPQRDDVIKYVLSDFSKAEQEKLPVLLKAAFAAIELWLSDEPREKVMGIVNAPDFVDKFGGENGKGL